MTKILFIDNGIEFDSKTLRERPYGGAEVAFVSLVENLSELGYEIVVYNNCVNQGKINGVNWKRIGLDLESEKFDTLVINRGDKYLNFKKECTNRIFWIHNPAHYLLKYRYLSKLFFNKFKIVFSSNYHLSTYPNWAPANERIVIPYGIDENLFKKKIKSRIPMRNAIFTSNPMRGLSWLLEKWENYIFPKSKNSKLLIYSGFQTYGKFGTKHSREIKEILLKAQSLKNMGVILNEPIKRENLFNKLENSRVFIYKGSADETFCMALAESQMLGVPAVVGNLGCLQERLIDGKTGFICNNDEEFCKNTVKLLNDDELWIDMNKELKKKQNYFTWKEVAKKWQKIIT